MAAEEEPDALKVYWEHFFKSETGTYEVTIYICCFISLLISDYSGWVRHILATEIEARFRNCERDAESMIGTCFDDLKLMLSGLLKYVQEKKYKAWRVSIRELESRKLSTQYSYF